MKISGQGLFVLTCIIVSFVILTNVAASSDINQELTINSLKLSTWRSTQYVDEDFFFHVYMNLTMSQWVDQSGIQKPAAINGPVLEIDHYKAGFAFDGIDDVMTVPNSRSLNPANKLTIEMWTKISAYGSNESGRDWFTLICKGSDWGDASYCLLFAPKTSERVIAFMINGKRVANVKAIAENELWYHIVATFNGSLAKIFLNGEQIISTPFYGNLTENNDDLYVGGEKGNIYPLGGAVGMLRIYNRTLSQDEIRLSYQRKELDSNGSLVLDLNLENSKYSFERSEDGYSFDEVFQSSIDQTSFSWKENHLGEYFYRIAMPSIENNTRVIRYSNVSTVDVVQQESKISITKLLYACVLVLTSVAVLLSSRKNKGAKLERDLE